MRRLISLWIIAICLLQATFAQSQGGAFTLETKLSELAPADQLTAYSAIYQDNSQMSWELFVPETYDPANPPGVLVYISPAKTGTAPRSWHRVLEDENLIFISANGAGNKAPTHQRLANAGLALRAVNRRYKTDPDRRYLSGFSGGARVSSIAVETIPNIFHGAIFMGGAFNWHGDTNTMAETLKGRSYVFITGRDDHARPEVVKAYRQYKDIETAHVNLIDDARHGHDLPNARTLKKALSFLSLEDGD